MPRKLSEVLLEEKVITKEQLLACLKHQKATGVSFTAALLAINALGDEEMLTDVLAKLVESKKIGVADLELDASVVQLVPPDIAQKFKIIAINRTKRFLTIAISDPKNLFVLDAVKFLTGCTIKPVVAPEAEILQAIRLNYRIEATADDILQDIKTEELEVLAKEEEEDLDDITSVIADAPVVKLVNHLITEAVRKGASDIHIETYQKILRVRFRIDGALVELTPLPFKLRPAIISRIKIMANLDISEKRLPQDGRIKLKIGINAIDIRVSTVPTIYGEKVVMRILDAANLILDIKQLGIPEPGLSHIMAALTAPFGMLLVTGPTGSGKTTTLYSALSLLNQPDVNIMTVEDPVEYNIDGINQINVNAPVGLTFASALRSFLRQDPDIIMVGEIRDLETAEIAIKAALTGHLVFSTLHTNNSVDTVARLLDMGVEPFLIASSTRCIVAQRLVRKICAHCREPDPRKPEDIARMLHVDVSELKGAVVMHGKGCPMCSNSGYKGRSGLYEVFPSSLTIQEMIIKKAPILDLKKAALAEGMKTLRMCAIERLRNGITTVEEVLGATDT